MCARLLLILAAGLAVGSGPRAPSGTVQSQVIPPGSRWARRQGGLLLVDEFGRDGVWRTFGLRGGLPSRYTLDLTGRPPCLVVPPFYGIYRLEGDYLFIRFSEKRPTSFHSGSGGELLILKRLK